MGSVLCECYHGASTDEAFSSQLDRMVHSVDVSQPFSQPPEARSVGSWRARQVWQEQKLHVGSAIWT